jgi:hypothetical protein
MNSTEHQQQMDDFYAQFADAAKLAHAAWVADPINHFELWRHPWKMEAPRVNCRSNQDIDPRSILNLLRSRHNKTAVQLPPVVVTGGTP